MDKDLSISRANEAFWRMVGYTPADVMGRFPLDFAAEDFRQFLTVNRTDLFSEQHQEFEGRLRMKALQIDDMGEIINAMNRHLALDVLDTGRFMTLFCLRLEVQDRRPQWLRTGPIGPDGLGHITNRSRMAVGPYGGGIPRYPR